jgi:hypothetical protein
VDARKAGFEAPAKIRVKARLRILGILDRAGGTEPDQFACNAAGLLSFRHEDSGDDTFRVHYSVRGSGRDVTVQAESSDEARAHGPPAFAPLLNGCIAKLTPNSMHRYHEVSDFAERGHTKGQ